MIIRLAHWSPKVSLLVIGLTLGLMSTATMHAQDATPPARSASTVITGKLASRDNASLSNARVSISRVGGGAVPQSPRVDANGSFKSDPLDPGLYSVSASIPGYLIDNSQVQSPTYYRPGDTVTITMIKGGVITGVVKNSNNEPIVNIGVRASRTRDAQGKPLPLVSFSRSVITDDRGVYRLYGLAAGSYVVSAGGPQRSSASLPSPFEGVPPTFAPAATRDTAVEIAVASGDEVTMDIAFRDDVGHAVSGTVIGASVPQNGMVGVVVTLLDARHHAEVANDAMAAAPNAPFAIYGVADGDYELYASEPFFPAGDPQFAPTRRIKVQGGDVTGINLTLTPLASIDGRLVIEPDPKAPCGKRRQSALLESLIYARRQPDQKSPDQQPLDVPYQFANATRSATVDANGNFAVKGTQPGTYALELREPASGWYQKPIKRQLAGRFENLPRAELAVKPGEHVSGLVLTLAEGAAKLSGRVNNLEGRVNFSAYLVPAEREAVDNVLRFYETRIEADATWSFENIAPGKYWILAQLRQEDGFGASRQIRKDATLRGKILKEAEALNNSITFKPCEEVRQFGLQLSAQP